jgi:hypothetical protein
MNGDRNYLFQNAFFRLDDPHSPMVGSFEVPEQWWSRRWEYTWGMTHAAPGQIVADMGCGWHYRPLHDWLAQTCEFCYGVDHHVEILDLPPMVRGEYVVADFAKAIPVIPERSLDRIFCISVLEELINYADALAEFARLLKNDGRIVLTCDAPFDLGKPTPRYPGVKMDELEAGMAKAGLVYDGPVNQVRYEDLLRHEEWNLCVWHCVLRKG